MEERSDAILIVEDDPNDAELLALVLAGRGYQVHIAADGEEALARLSNGLRPGLVLLDVSMPGMDGPSFLARFREMPALKGIPVVLCTGYPAEHLGRVPADGYLPKSAGPRSIFALVERFLARDEAVRTA